MNSQGFPCFSGQRNPGLTQQMMKGAHNMGQRPALSPEAPGNTLGKSFIQQGAVTLGTAVPAESRQAPAAPSMCSSDDLSWVLEALCAPQSPVQLPEGGCLLSGLLWTPQPRLSAHTPGRLQRVRACLRDPGLAPDYNVTVCSALHPLLHWLLWQTT